MTIHHDKMAYGKVAPNSEELSEDSIQKMLKLLEEEAKQNNEEEAEQNNKNTLDTCSDNKSDNKSENKLDNKSDNKKGDK
jgi:hypothetical protein